MDLDEFDDFELNDELIATSSFIEEQENDRSIETTNLPYLHCSGVDSSRASFHRSSYVRNCTSTLSVIKQCVENPLFDWNLSDDALFNPQIIQMLFNKARMHIQILDVSSREDAIFSTSDCQSYFALRLQVTKFLTVLHALVQQDLVNADVIQEGLRSLQVLLGSMEATPITKVLHNANSNTGNECSSPVYHLLHGHLEWRWLRLMTLLRIAKNEPNEGITTLRDSYIEEQIQMFLCDLVTLSISKYNRLKHVELLYNSPFLCTCVKEMWLMLQLELEILQERDYLNSFWYYFNSILECVRDGKNAYELYDKTKIKRKVVNKLLPANWNEFSVWLLSGVAKLHGFSSQGDAIGCGNIRVKDNYDFMEKLVRNILSSDPTEESLRIILYLTFPIFVEWWAPRTEILITFWEYFHKKLNSSFFLQGSAPCVLAVISGSVVGYLKQIKDTIEESSVNPNKTSYSIFIHLIGRVLKKFADSDESQIKKILGRITSKLSSLKMLALNETGIHNVVSMFLTLAITSKLSETGQRIQNVLLQMPLYRLTTNRQIALLRGHISLLILFTEKHLNISSYTTKILEQLTTIHLDESYGQALKMLADGMLEIFANTASFELGEYVLLDVWLDKHLSSVGGAEQERILKCINDCLTKIPSIMFAVDTQRVHNLHETLAAIYKHILPYVQRTFGQKDGNDNIGGCVAELAANLCLNVHHCPSSTQKFDELFKIFTEGNFSNIQTLTSFLVLILSTDKLQTIQQSFIIRCWIKCNICSNTPNMDLNSLTAIVVSLEEFRVVCDVEASDIVGAKDPLCMFFSEIGKSYQQTTDFRKKYLISEKVYSYLDSFDSYVTISLENPDNTMKIYSMIAIIILHCSEIVYIKGKNSCFFNVAMFQYILPNHLLTGRPQKPQHVQAVHKIWHLLLMGIGKLDFRNDKHLLLIVTNLIEKWLPQFKSSQSKQASARPFLNCLKDCDTIMVNYVFDKVSSTFLQLQRRQPHQHATQVLSMLNELVPNIRMDSGKLETLLKTTGYTIMEHAMMVDDSALSKSMIFDFFRCLVQCDGYQSSADLRDIMCSHLTMLTSKHLAYYSALYFQCLQRFGKIDPVAVKSIIPHLKEVIANVELMRGAGRDGKLRNELHKLEGALMAVT